MNDAQVPEDMSKKIEEIILSTWSSSYYQGGHEFTQSGKRVKVAVEEINELLHLERQKVLKEVREKIPEIVEAVCGNYCIEYGEDKDAIKDVENIISALEKEEK